MSDAGWHDDAASGPVDVVPDLTPVTPWAVKSGVGVGVFALLLVGCTIGWVVGKGTVQALFGEAEGITQEEPVQPNAPAFRGIEVNRVPGVDRARPPTEAGANLSPRKAHLPHATATSKTPGTHVPIPSGEAAGLSGEVPPVVTVRPRPPDTIPRPPETVLREIRVSDPDGAAAETVRDPESP